MAQKKILMIIAPRNFRDEEYFIPKEAFAKQGFSVITASSSLGIAYGKLGGQAGVDLLLEQIEVRDYSALVFVGGPGARNYFDHPEIKRVLKDASEQGAVLAAICIAPVILAKNGFLKGKKATVWSTSNDQEAPLLLSRGGAQYLKQDVVVDGKIITACGPKAASEFAQAIILKIKA